MRLACRDERKNGAKKNFTMAQKRKYRIRTDAAAAVGWERAAWAATPAASPGGVEKEKIGDCPQAVSTCPPNARRVIQRSIAPSYLRPAPQ